MDKQQVEQLVEQFAQSIGKTVTAQYRRAGWNGPSTQIAVEVTDVVALPTRRGKVAYVFGTRVDPEKAGDYGLFRIDSMHASTISFADTAHFVPVEGYEEGEFYITANSASFGYPDRVAAEDVAWALEDGAQPMKDFSVAVKAA